MDFVSRALDPMKAIVWGEDAMDFVGVGLFREDTIVVVQDSDFEESISRLRSADFRQVEWSFGAREPEFYQGPVKERIYRRIVNDFYKFDANCARFLFPPNSETLSHKAVLLRSSYAHISLQSTPIEQFTCKGNLFWPNAATLLRSFVQTLVKESPGMWRSTLETWAISYVYGQLLMLSDNVLDSCDDEEARKWFDDAIYRHTGGLDRVTCTKRLGRVGYDDRLARTP